VVEMATDTAGGPAATSTSAATSAVTDIMLAFTSQASVTGTAQGGLMLTAVNGALNDSDAAVTGYQWQASSDGGTTWANISGATSPAYTVQLTDASHLLRVIETATDGDGGPSVTSTSVATSAVTGGTLALVVSISGEGWGGHTVGAVATTNDANARIAYQWQEQVHGKWNNIVGATSSIYTVPEADEGHKLRVKAVASDPAVGSATAFSAATATATDPPPVLTVTSSSLTLPKGGKVPLHVSVSGHDQDDNVSVKISGLSSHETITDRLDGNTFKPQHGSVTLTAAEVNSGLTLHSTYKGGGSRMNTLALTASDTEKGKTVTSSAHTITVTDPAVIAELHPRAVGSFATLAQALDFQDWLTSAELAGAKSAGHLGGAHESVALHTLHAGNGWVGASDLLFHA
jgi:hypothetical protein